MAEVEPDSLKGVARPVGRALRHTGTDEVTEVGRKHDVGDDLVGHSRLTHDLRERLNDLCPTGLETLPEDLCRMLH